MTTENSRYNIQRAATPRVSTLALNMDIQHWHLLGLIAMVGAPILLAIAATAVAWRSINRRALFLVVAVLSLWGLGSVTYPIALSVLNPSGGGPASYPSAEFNVLLANAILVALVGFPVLWWLRNALRRA